MFYGKVNIYLNNNYCLNSVTIKIQPSSWPSADVTTTIIVAITLRYKIVIVSVANDQDELDRLY